MNKFRGQISLLGIKFLTMEEEFLTRLINADDDFDDDNWDDDDADKEEGDDEIIADDEEGTEEETE